LALEALDRWRRHHRFADKIVQELLGQTDLSGEDRGFAVDPFYGALRNLTLLDFRIDRLPPGSLDANSRDIPATWLDESHLIGRGWLHPALVME
jgi:hypothetical protein